MATDGKALERPSAGWVSTEILASFDTKAEADAFASEHGWSVSDDSGPNHRCRECKNTPEPEPYSGMMYDERRGAYIRAEDLLRSPK